MRRSTLDLLHEFSRSGLGFLQIVHCRIFGASYTAICLDRMRRNSSEMGATGRGAAIGVQAEYMV